MFKLDLDTGDFESAKRRFRTELVELQYRAVGEGSRLAVAEARKAGSFQDRTGELRASIRVISPRRTGDKVQGGFEATAKHATFVEDGTKAHLVRPIDYQTLKGGARHTVGVRAGRQVKNATVGVGRGQYLRFYIGGRVVFAREVHHPGTKPDPFMGPASVIATVRMQQIIEDGIPRLQASIWDR
jgi:hypothetical protein